MPSSRKGVSPPRLPFGAWLALLLAVGVVVRWPLLWEAATVTPDGAEYLAIARSLRKTGQYATDLKWQFYTEDPVRHAAWVDRPPLYPAFAALCAMVLPGLDPTAAARVGNVLLAALAQVLAALYLRRLFGPVVALTASGYMFLLPHTVYWTSQPLTEALTLCLLLATLLLWARQRPSLSVGEREEGSGVTPGNPPPPWISTESSPLSESGERGWGGEVSGRWPPGLIGIAGVGVLCGLATLTRPTGLLLLGALLLDLFWPRCDRAEEKPARRWRAAAALLAGYVVTVLPYHWMLLKTAGSPFASALGFTFTITTIYDVTVLGFERASPTLLTFLREHGTELPGLLLRQAASHAQGLLLPLLGLLPFAWFVRRADLGGPRRAGFLLVGLLLLTHTLTWSAKGSSRYFLFCLLLFSALLLGAAVRKWGVGEWGSGEVSEPPTSLPLYPRLLTRLLLAASLLGLGIELTRFLTTQLRPDHGLAALPAWKAVAERVRGAELVASDQPWILNLLAERPAVMLPRTADPEKLGRFIARYQPDVLILFPDEPAERAMRDAWRADMLPAGWRVIHAEAGYLEARRIGSAR